MFWSLIDFVDVPILFLGCFCFIRACLFRTFYVISMNSLSWFPGMLLKNRSLNGSALNLLSNLTQSLLRILCLFFLKIKFYDCICQIIITRCSSFKSPWILGIFMFCQNQVYLRRIIYVFLQLIGFFIKLLRWHVSQTFTVCSILLVYILKSPIIMKLSYLEW